MSIGWSASGSFHKTEEWLRKMMDASIFDQLTRFGEEGVRALSAATPQDTGETAMSWGYEIVKEKGSWSIIWTNSHMDDNGATPVAVLLQTGHGTGTGGYVTGIDYINPALRPIFDRMADAAWKVVTS